AVDANNYTIYRSTSPGTEGTTPYLSGIPTNNFEDTNVVNGTRYYYQVTASNNSGENTQRSPEANAQPLVSPAPPPSPIRITEGIGTIQLDWDAVPFADSYDVWR